MWATVPRTPRVFTSSLQWLYAVDTTTTMMMMMMMMMISERMRNRGAAERRPQGCTAGMGVRGSRPGGLGCGGSSGPGGGGLVPCTALSAGCCAT